MKRCNGRTSNFAVVDTRHQNLLPLLQKSSRHTKPLQVRLFIPILLPDILMHEPVPPATTIPTLNPAIDRLSQQLAKLATSHATNTAALNSLAQERAEVDSREKEMREMVGKAEEKRAWFGSFREWLESVAGFLDEKVRYSSSF